MVSKDYRAKSVMMLALVSIVCFGQQTGWDGSDFGKVPSRVDPAAIKADGPVDIEWVPAPYRFKVEGEVAYIDFENGDDANTGRSKDSAWKHHPWDPNASGNAKGAKGICTYVFKGGVVYRGRLICRESGTAAQPIRLVRDPSWGDGEATIAGSDAIRNGWKLLSVSEVKAAGLPAQCAGKVWSVRLPLAYRPWALWFLEKDGSRRRLPIARWPNWKIEHPYNHFTQWFRVKAIRKGFPRTTIYAPHVLKDPDKDAYKGATIWIDHANTSGEFSIIGPFPSGIGSYNPRDGSLQPSLTHPARHPVKNAPFYLENLPRFLDEAGEWYYDMKSRRLFLWLPGDRDPNTVTVEVAQRKILLDIEGQRYIEVAGLSFTGGNARDLNDAPRAGNYDRTNNYCAMAAIRLRNDCRHIRLHHLNIYETAGAGIVNEFLEKGCRLSDIEVADSRFESIDNDGVKFTFQSAPIRFPQGLLSDIRVLRNSFMNIGLRCSSDQGGRGIDLSGVERAEIAGNVLHTIAAQGINVVGGRFGVETPMVRVLIYANKVVDSLMQKQDFGGIEFWGVGPVYVYNNISANPVGLVAHRGVYHKNHAYYFDHGAKGYLFNNIGWSERRKDAYKGIVGSHFFHEIRNQWNEAFHNTAYCFLKGQAHTISHGDQQHYLANVFVDCYFGSLSHWRLDDAAEIAYANNIFAGKYEAIYNRWRGETFHTPMELAKHLRGQKNHLSGNPGWATDDNPLRDPEKRDFRPTDTSAVIDRGVKVFVPWGLARTVGEWHFRLHPRDPSTVLGYDAYIQPFHKHHEHLRLNSAVPKNNLHGEGFGAAMYIESPLESWVKSALRFDRAHYLSLPHARLIRDFKLESGRGKRRKVETVSGSKRKTVDMSTNNFLMEVILLAEPDGMIAGKIDEKAGYALMVNPAGKVALMLRSGGAQAVTTSSVSIADGRWHHVLAEVDREERAVTFYIDGQKAVAKTAGTLPAAGESLSNTADFVVGKGFAGAIDYLRVSRCTLSEAATSIDELMAWEFNGPHLYDFAGRPPTGGVRDAGALEHPTISGRQPIRYTPPVVKQAAEDETKVVTDKVFKRGPERMIKTYDWGVVSVPREVRIGDDIDFQVCFGTETIPRAMYLQVDLHGWAGRKRLSTIGRAARVRITPGVTSPYEVRVKVRKREGLTHVAVVFYVSPDGGYNTRILGGEIPVKLK